MKKGLLVLAILITCQLQAADYYWVGGGGDWSDINHWRLGSSTGAPPSIVPSSGDNVFFDANSGFGATAASKTVNLDANGFCNNMTWSNVPNSPLFITVSSTTTVQISGSLSLSPTTTYQAIFAFKGSTPATITTNGAVLGQFGMEIDKPGSSLTVTDSLIVPSALNTAGTNGVTFTSGTFDLSGKKMTVYSFNSANNNARTLEITNANLNVVTTINSGYRVTGLNKTINASGSTLLAGAFITDGGAYNRVTVTTAAGPNTIIINSTTFKALTFSPVSGGIFSDIMDGNTVDTLIFNGQGSIRQNNTIGSVLFGLVGSIVGTGNSIRKITAQHNFDVGGANTVDSVLLASNRTTTFSGVFNINKYLHVAGAPCDAYTEIYGDSTAGYLNFALGAVVDINNVILTGVKATGPVTFAVNGIDGGGNAGFIISEPSSSGTTFYWVGGAGNWNDRVHWSASSGGSGGGCIPFKSDNVVFDASSGLAGGTVTTSSTAFCNNMTWATGVGTVTFTGATLRVYGSVALQSSVTLNMGIQFSGGSAATLATNGGGQGAFTIFISKTGSGSLTLLDDWSNPAQGNINFASGNLSMAGRNVSVYIFTGSSSGVARNLDISNATITTNYRWQYLGGNKLITSTGSHITANGTFQVNNPGGSYPWVDLTETAGERFFDINGAVIGQLTFTNASATSGAHITSNNAIRRLEFKGAGNIAGGGNNIDSLILTGSRNYYFAGANTINEYIKAEATTCSGLTEMRGNPTGSLAFGSAAEVHMANIYMQNMTATGLPIAFNGADAGGNFGWTITSAAGSPRYWIGGAGDWNNSNHWSASSGGVAGACVPTVYDDVYFDAGSGFTTGSRIVTINNGNAYCRNLNWTGAANSPTWSKAASWTVEVWGDSIILNPAATFNVSPITLKGSDSAVMKGQALGDFDVTIDKFGSALTLLNDYDNSTTSFALTNGAFIAPGLALNVSAISNGGSNLASSIDVNHSTITTTFWNYSGAVANHTLNAANSSITASSFLADGWQYDTININSGQSNSTVINAVTINRLTFTNDAPASVAGIAGNNNILGTVEYKSNGGIYGTGNTIDTLIFFPGSTYTLNAGTTTTINGDWFGSGTPCRATEIVSSGATNAIITKNGSPVNFDYIRLRRITADGTAAPFVAMSHSTDLGNNSNWSIASYDAVAPIYGLGPDTAVLVENFPITLHTDGFFGSPSSQYIWNDNSTADTLLVTGPGTYSLSVGFPDGCSIPDSITVSLFDPLPVKLVNFTAKATDCQTLVQWKVADAVNFSHFVVERSTDGQHFTAIASLPYTGAANYKHTDLAPENGTSYYRLKLVDIDARYTYSKTVSANTSCGLNLIKVYPTISNNAVQIVLPEGYEKARIYIVNVFGQRIVPVMHGSSGSLRTVSLQGLPAASYVLQVINGKETKSFKIVKP